MGAAQAPAERRAFRGQGAPDARKVGRPIAVFPSRAPRARGEAEPRARPPAHTHVQARDVFLGPPGPVHPADANHPAGAAGSQPQGRRGARGAPQAGARVSPNVPRVRAQPRRGFGQDRRGRGRDETCPRGCRLRLVHQD